MDKLLKEQLLPILIVVLFFFGGGYLSYNTWSQWSEVSTQKNEKEQELQTKTELLNTLEAKKKASEVKEEKKPETATSGKAIPEISGQQFTPEASFGVMFESVLSNITNSGIKIRDIKYNYQPADDKILSAGMDSGYNACELSFITVGSYSQFQNFFKSVAKDTYLSSIYEIYIEPYDRDKTILITRFKIRLYTRTV